MPARLKSLLLEYAPLIVLTLIWFGAAKYQLGQKEDASAHQLDVQKIEAETSKGDQALQDRFNVLYNLVLDMRCEQKPNDRRCKGYTP